MSLLCRWTLRATYSSTDQAQEGKTLHPTHQNDISNENDSLSFSSPANILLLCAATSKQ